MFPFSVSSPSHLSLHIFNVRHRPDDAWLDDFCAACAPTFPRQSAAGLGIIALGLADLKHVPRLEWSTALLEEFHRKACRGAPSGGGGGAGAGAAGSASGSASGSGSGSASGSGTGRGSASGSNGSGAVASGDDVSDADGGDDDDPFSASASGSGSGRDVGGNSWGEGSQPGARTLAVFIWALSRFQLARGTLAPQPVPRVWLSRCAGNCTAAIVHSSSPCAFCAALNGWRRSWCRARGSPGAHATLPAAY